MPYTGTAIRPTALDEQEVPALPRNVFTSAAVEVIAFSNCGEVAARISAASGGLLTTQQARRIIRSYLWFRRGAYRLTQADVDRLSAS